MAKRFGFIMAVCIGAILIVIAAIVLVLYVVPNSSIGGIKSVYLKNQFTNYYGPDIEQIFDPQRRNIIIESDKTPVTIRVRSDGQGDENSITVFENANGITFNSISKTRLSFMQEFGEDGLVYTRISVIQPKGAVVRSARIYINLKNEYSAASYNFILRNGSSVSFEADLPSQIITIDKLIVQGTGHIAVPTSVTGANSVTMKVGELTVDSSNASVNCRADILRNVTINGYSRNITLGKVYGNVNIEGKSHNVTMGEVSGSVQYNGTSGNLKASSILGNLIVTGDTIGVDVGRVNNNTIINKYGNVSIGRVLGSSDITMETGSLTLGKSNQVDRVIGDVIVNGDIDNPKYKGSTTVYFADTSIGRFRTFAVNGNVSVYGARNHVHIEVAAYGTATVTVEFSDVLAGTTMEGANKIIVHGSRELSKNGGDVTIKLGKSTTSFLLHLENTFEVLNGLVNPSIEWFNTIRIVNNKQIIDTPYKVGNGGNYVWVKTHASVRITR